MRWPQPGAFLQPSERGHLGELIIQARSRGISIGSPGADYHWDLSRLNRVVSFYAPDMVLSVETGLSMSAVKDVVEAQRLWLPLDSSGNGELPVAEYLAGDQSLSWLSHRYRTARDWVVSMTAVDDHGREVTSGARLVKNVAGYQLAPLYIGAEHSLGPVVEVSFRLLPLPTDLTLARWEAEDPSRLMTILQAARQREHPSRHSDPWEGLRLEHREGRWQLDGITRFPPNVIETWVSTANDELAQTIVRVNNPPREGELNGVQAELRILAQPTRIPKLLEALQPLGSDLVCYPASGIINLGSPPSQEGKEALETMLVQVVVNGGLVQPLMTDLSVKLPRPAEVVGEQTIMARVKTILDPEGVFGPLPAKLC
ncbi:MAG: FAD-binding oxidoreductase [Candidatus Neomarinimicrobiota bacterium]